MLLQGMISENYVNQGIVLFLVFHYFNDYGKWGWIKQGPPWKALKFYDFTPEC